MFIGERIKQIRTSKKMSLSELAQQSGVQIATLSRMEHMKMTGTLDSHMKIAQALNVELAELFVDPAREANAVDFCASSAADVFRHSDKSSYEILASKISSRKMLPILLKIDPKGKTNQEKKKKGTEKFLYILKGTVIAHIGDKEYNLPPSSSLYFDASLSHQLENPKDTTAKIICITTPADI